MRWILIIAFLFLLGSITYYLLRRNEYLPDPVPLVAPEVEYPQVYEELRGKG